MSDAGEDTSDVDAGLPPPSRYTTAGNDADVEDNDLPPFTPVPDVYALREKMRRSAPKYWTPTTPCKLQSERKDAKKDRRVPSANDRLSTRPKSAVEMVADTIERPKGVVPSLALPHWHSLPLDKKIPFLPAPAGFMYYSPGKVGEKLNRQAKAYSLNDPHNRERALSFAYSAISDPHAKSFLKKWTTKEILYNQGIINENEEVIISLREFNKYRDYLRTLHVDEVNQSLRNVDELFKKDREQIRLIKQNLIAEAGGIGDQQRKTTQSRRMLALAEHRRSGRLLRKHEQTDTRLQMWAKEKERICMQRLLLKTQRERLQEERLQSVKKAYEIVRRKKLQKSVIKVLRSTEKRAQELEAIKKTNETFLMEWIDAKINQSEARLEKERNISRSWRANLKARAQIRQRRMEALRDDLPYMIERKKKEQARLLEVARKYFHIWLKRVRNIRAENEENNAHASVWLHGATGSLKKTVDYIQFQTDTHDKLDDFIVSILRLKSAIKRQLALEGSDDESVARSHSSNNESIYATVPETETTEIRKSKSAVNFAAETKTSDNS